MKAHLGNDLELGTLVGKRTPWTFKKEDRDKHFHICGGTGTGKSKFLEHLIWQDITNWSGSKCGLLLLDPHGEVYRSLMTRLARHRPNRPIIPIDFETDDWVVGYNPLRPRTNTKAQVIVDMFLDAISYVWGADGTNETPLFERWGNNVLRTLYDNNLSLIESRYLIDRIDGKMREKLASVVGDELVRQDWAFANTLTAEKLDTQLSSTINRFQRFIRNDFMRRVFGQTDESLDLGKALDDGSIILVNLGIKGGNISEANSAVFATLLLSDLWNAARNERGKYADIKPFHVYIDEFQFFITPTIAESLDQARGFGISCTLSHQFPKQISDGGDNANRIYNSLMETASSKVVFHLTEEENLIPMARWLFRGTFNPDEVKDKLYSTKVLDYREEYRTIYGESHATGQSSTTNYSHSDGHSYTNLVAGDDVGRWAQHVADASGGGSASNEVHGSSQTESIIFKPVMGEEVSHVQFRSLEEQLFRAMAVLFDQKQRQCVARLVGMKTPVSLFTPTVNPSYVSPENFRAYREELLSKLPFAIRREEADKRIAARDKKLRDSVTENIESVDEPKGSKRRIKRK